MKDMFNASKFQKILVGICFVALGGAVFITNNTAQANEPIIKEVEAGKKSFFGKRDFFVSVLHDDVGWEHYADGFEILSVSGEIIAKRVLAHPHVDEQPVTRDLRSVCPYRKGPPKLMYAHTTPFMATAQKYAFIFRQETWK